MVHVLKEALGGGEIVKSAKFIDVCYKIEPFKFFLSVFSLFKTQSRAALLEVNITKEPGWEEGSAEFNLKTARQFIQ